MMLSTCENSSGTPTVFGNQTLTVPFFSVSSASALMPQPLSVELIASSVNDNLLSLVIDNKEYTNENHTFYMDDQLNIMVPVNILRDALSCSAHVYDGKRLLVEKHANEVEFSLGALEAKVNGTSEAIVSPFICKDDTYYVSLNDLANYLDYSYSWDIQENQASAMDTSDSATIIPTRYDLRAKGRAAAVRNQGTFGTCWAHWSRRCCRKRNCSFRSTI